MGRWREAWDAVLDVVWPPACMVCDQVLPAVGAWCAECALEVSELPSVHCERCAEPGRYEQGWCTRCELGVPWERAYAPFEHEGALARAIHRFKYEDRSDLARPLGLLLASAAAPVLEAMPGVLVPLPLHEQRFRTRRYDQAALLAQTLAKHSGRRLELSWLERVRHTPRQVGLTEAEREANVRGAFQASPDVRGQTVVVIDDVLTSGATAREACRALDRAGAETIFVLTLARARSHREV